MKNPVPYRVECAFNGGRFFEVIAAFNDARIALQYAVECQRVNSQSEYRVTYRKRVLHDKVYVAGAAILETKLGRVS